MGPSGPGIGTIPQVWLNLGRGASLGWCCVNNSAIGGGLVTALLFFGAKAVLVGTTTSSCASAEEELSEEGVWATSVIGESASGLEEARVCCFLTGEPFGEEKAEADRLRAVVDIVSEEDTPQWSCS